MSRPQTRDSVYFTEQQQMTEVQQILKTIELESEIMARALSNNDVAKAIQCSSTIGKELRTTTLSPKNYYHLYLAVMNSFTPLFMYLSSEYTGSLIGLYEQVQYIYYAVPRLYMMCCVGAAAVKRKSAAVDALMKDLVEMCRAVQHPTKGLFVRSYLMDVLKDKLPDGNTTGEGNGCLMDSVDFLLVNFIEMNKLMVRMHAGVKGNEKKAEEQRQLCQLVARNLQFLSGLEGMNFSLYREKIMPKVLDQIISCGDCNAQEFLMDVLISAFPANYHVCTLEELLRAFPVLHKSLDARALLLNLMKTFITYIKSDDEPTPLVKKIDVFGTFHRLLLDICTKRKIPSTDFLALMASFQELQMAWYASDPAKCYKQTGIIFDIVINNLPEESLNNYAQTHLLRLLQSTLLKFSVHQIIDISGYRSCTKLLPYEKRKYLASDIITRCINCNERLDSVEFTKNVFDVIEDLLYSSKDQPVDGLTEDTIAIDCEKVCKLLHLIECDSQTFETILTLFKDKTTTESVRVKYVASPLLFSALSRKSEPEMVKFIFAFALAILKMLSKLDQNLLCFRLSLQCGIAASVAGVEKFAYFFKFAFENYENIASSFTQMECLNSAIGILQHLAIDEVVFKELLNY
ncbi:Vacuolar sorting protein [Entamoeba marina]